MELVRIETENKIRYINVQNIAYLEKNKSGNNYSIYFTTGLSLIIALTEDQLKELISY